MLKSILYKNIIKKLVYKMRQDKKQPGLDTMHNKFETEVKF